MKRVVTFLLIALVAGLMTTANGKEPEKRIPDYEPVSINTNGSTSYVELKITSKKKHSLSEYAKCAVHFVLFGKPAGENSVMLSSPTIMVSPLAEQQYADFFNKFFESSYASYASVDSTSRKPVKIAETGEKAISYRVAVSTSQLRRDLETLGLIDGLNTWE